MGTLDANMDDDEFITGLKEADIATALSHVLSILRSQLQGTRIGLYLMVHDDPGVWANPHDSLTKILEEVQRVHDLVVATREHLLPRLRS